MKILSFGSLNYDYTYEVEHFLAPKETLAAKSMQRGFGGKGANQLSPLHELDCQYTMRVVSAQMDNHLWIT